LQKIVAVQGAGLRRQSRRGMGSNLIAANVNFAQPIVKLRIDYCASMEIPVWHGGMLESGIGRAGNVALASLPNFTLPGDISASKRYYLEDIVEPEFVVNPDGTMDVPVKPGIGVDINMKMLDKVTVKKEVFTLSEFIK